MDSESVVLNASATLFRQEFPCVLSFSSLHPSIGLI
jgi:hypothetical protein